MDGGDTAHHGEHAVRQHSQHVHGHDDMQKMHAAPTMLHDGMQMHAMAFHFGVNETILFGFWRTQSAFGFDLAYLNKLPLGQNYSYIISWTFWGKLWELEEYINRRSMKDHIIYYSSNQRYVMAKFVKIMLWSDSVRMEYVYNRNYISIYHNTIIEYMYILMKSMQKIYGVHKFLSCALIL